MLLLEQKEFPNINVNKAMFVLINVNVNCCMNIFVSASNGYIWSDGEKQNTTQGLNNAKITPLQFIGV